MAKYDFHAIILTVCSFLISLDRTDFSLIKNKILVHFAQYYFFCFLSYVISGNLAWASTYPADSPTHLGEPTFWFHLMLPWWFTDLHHGSVEGCSANSMVAFLGDFFCLFKNSLKGTTYNWLWTHLLLLCRKIITNITQLEEYHWI